MCGIAGIFDLLGKDPIDRSLLQRMSDAIAHRGPDGDGFHVEPGVGLAHRRLAIIDLATGAQPIYNEDGSVAIVFNGQIYNYVKLTEELRALGHRFATRSDTEAIVHAWEEWGADCVKRLRGMYAFAIFDRNRNALLLARDRLGKKPIYYTFVRGRYCVFASELKALLVHPLVAKKISRAAVDDYLALGYVPDPATIYEGIFKLPAASTLCLKRGDADRQPREYWRLAPQPRPIGAAEAAEALIEHLREAVKIRLMSEVPLGAFLSGGVDSSAIVAMMARESATPIKTFALGFDDYGIDELPHAQRVADRYGTEHRSERVVPDFLGAYREQAAIFDEPFADSSSVPTYQVSKLARRHVTVALSGDAGDEVFAGYRRYRFQARMEALRHMLPSGLRAGAFGVLGRVYPKLDWAPRWLRAKYTFHELALDGIAGYYRMVSRIHDDLRMSLYGPAMRESVEAHHPLDTIATHMQAWAALDPVARAQLTDIKTYLVGDILTKVDRASMAASLEVRAPILDHVFVEWAASLPSDLKLRGGEGKYIFKRALEPYVPRENLYRSKQGFAGSLAKQFRGAGTERLRAALQGDAMGDAGIFDMRELGRLIDDHASGLADHSQALWTLLMFEGFLLEVHFSTGAHRAPLSAELAVR